MQKGTQGVIQPALDPVGLAGASGATVTLPQFYFNFKMHNHIQSQL